MFDLADILETALRGAAAGISFLLVLALLIAQGDGARVRRLGALFTFSNGVYVLISGEAARDLVTPVLVPISVIAIYGTVFFWWFAAALFDDNFRWRWWRFAPAVIIPFLHIGHIWAPPGAVETLLWYSHVGLNSVMFLDALRLALANASDDLVNPRRRFRFALAVTVGVFGLIIASAETIERNYLLPDTLRMVHAAAIFVLTLVFAVWLLRPRMALFAAPAPDPETSWAAQAQKALPGDRPAYERLMALMEEGVYRQEGLTVAALAEKVGVPEHQLRKLINGALGFRNFSSFLNARRIEDAKAELSNRDNARKQIIQIALDLGYGSIAPFNRAFKQATGQTPTEYRKAALGNG
ncbi:helix-turn-helix domain-containing protein [Hyphococcus sp.]|jgi:AraC-like DNA-binding protein|uniref:helix-turn-helix domain-containing protein n=1 Tax=Hyphococcus sp. TaxID=2038636 RepID=UPI003D0C2C9B